MKNTKIWSTCKQQTQSGGYVTAWNMRGWKGYKLSFTVIYEASDNLTKEETKSREKEEKGREVRWRLVSHL
jgi:hypothetical protein